MADGFVTIDDNNKLPAVVMAELDTTYSKVRVVTPPEGFSFDQLPVPLVQRLGGRRFSSDLDLGPLRPAAGVTYYVAANGDGNNSGLSPDFPLTIPTAMNKADVGTIVYEPGEYFRNGPTHTTAELTKSLNHIASGPGVKVTGWNNPDSTIWTVHSGSIYVTSRSATDSIIDVDNRTEWGDYTAYEQKLDAASIDGPGQFALASPSVYVWPIGGTDLSVAANRWQIRIGVMVTTGIHATGGTHYVRGIDFEGTTVGGLTAENDAFIIAEDCTSKYSAAWGGISIKGGKFIGIRCEASSNFYDGFNYHHSTGVLPVEFIEIDCRAHHNGMVVSNTDNGSTAHEECRGLRIGGDYGASSGPSMADVNSSRTWNLGCVAGKSLAYDAYARTAFRLDSVGFESDPAQMWLDECTAEGADYAYHATGVGGSIHVHAPKVQTVNVTNVADGSVVTYEP